MPGFPFLGILCALRPKQLIGNQEVRMRYRLMLAILLWSLPATPIAEGPTLNTAAFVGDEG